MTEELYITEAQRLRPGMVQMATRYLENLDDAEDIVQEALLKMWTMRQMITTQTADRIAFLIVKQLCISELRKREYRKVSSLSLADMEVADTATDPQELEERDRQLMKAVKQLPSKQRILLQMRYLKGEDYSSISQKTGCSEAYIRLSLSRARTAIYKIMSAVVVLLACVFIPASLYRSHQSDENSSMIVAKTEKHVQSAPPPSASTTKANKPASTPVKRRSPKPVDINTQLATQPDTHEMICYESSLPITNPEQAIITQEDILTINKIYAEQETAELLLKLKIWLNEDAQKPELLTSQLD